MMGFVFLVVIALVFAVIWINLAKRPGPRAKIGPDGTNVRNPETFVAHHEGKGQGLDIANTALKERTEELSRDLPGDAEKIKTAIPGRDMAQMEAPPSDLSRYGDEKVAPGATPGQRGAESKAKVLMEGPPGSRPETPEEPGSPHQKGRRVTDTHRDVELAEEVLPAAFAPGQVKRRQAASPSTAGREPGYGLGRTRPGQTDGEGGPAPGGREPLRFQRPQAEPDVSPRRRTGGPGDQPDFPVEQPELEDELGDIPNGAMPSRTRGQDSLVSFRPDFEVGEEMITFQPDPQAPWAALDEPDRLPEAAEDGVTAIVRNPRSLYVYWERAGGGEQRLREMLGEAAFRATRPCLRVFDVSTEGAFTIDVHEQDDHWFINDLEPGHRYVVSFERRTDAGQYFLVSLSAPVSTPAEAAGQAGLLYDRLEQMTGDRATSPSSPWR